MTTSSPERLHENPWLWLALFGGMGVSAVAMIGPKYAARQARLERMSEARRSVVERRAAATSPAEPPPPALPSSVPYEPADFRPPAALYRLMGLMTLLMLIGVGGLLVSRRRSRSTTEQTP